MYIQFSDKLLLNVQHKKAWMKMKRELVYCRFEPINNTKPFYGFNQYNIEMNNGSGWNAQSNTTTIAITTQNKQIIEAMYWN